MELVLMRHGRAEERRDFAKTGQPDELRPLTGKGGRQLRNAVPGLFKVASEIDLVVTSPLLRARQSAELVVEGSGVPLKELPSLAPGGDHAEVNQWLRRQRCGVVLLVGHEPDLGSLASWYLTGSGASFISLKKGAICLLHFNDKPAPGEGTLQLLLTSAQLRQLG